MKTIVILIIWLTPLVVTPPLAIAADRDSADRQTRQESDELRADMRQRRLKKVRELDNPGQQQKKSAEPLESATGGASSGN